VTRRRAGYLDIVRQLAWLFMFLFGAAACGGSQSQGGSVIRPLEERRARALIEEALLAGGVTPARPRSVELPSGSDLIEDMAVESTKYGVAYLTRLEQTALGAAVPAFDPNKLDLTLARGGDGEVVLLLYEQAFEYDAGADHTTNIVTIERKLKRDVTDYVLHVVKPDKVR
jgi:hypothetical protein